MKDMTPLKMQYGIYESIIRTSIIQGLNSIIQLSDIVLS